MARASKRLPAALPKTPSSKKTLSKKKDSVQNAQLMTPAHDTPSPSTNSLLAQTVLTTDQWYRSKSTKNGYANYVKAGKKWLAEWVEKNTSESSTTDGQRIDIEASKLAGAFDAIVEETPLALRLLIAFKCEHQQCGFSTAEGIRAAFKDYFSRVLLCQGDFWKLNERTEKWDGNPVFQSDFKVYFESLKNRQNRTATVVQALPMLPADMKVIMNYLDTSEGEKEISEVRRLCWKAFAMTSFCLWTRNEELINFKYGDVRMCQESAAGELYHEFDIVFRKTNKDPTKGMIQQLSNFNDSCLTVNTIMRYLLDELTSYEEGFSDIMMASRPSERHESFMATGDPGGHVTRNDFHELAMSLKKQLDSVALSTPVPSPATARYSFHDRSLAAEDQRRIRLSPHTPQKLPGRYSPYGRHTAGPSTASLVISAAPEGSGCHAPDAPMTSGEIPFLWYVFSPLGRLRTRSELGDLSIETPHPSRPLPSLFPQLEPAQDEVSMTTTEVSAPPRLGANVTDPYHNSIQLTDPVHPIAPRIPKTSTMDDVIKYWTKGHPPQGLMGPLRDWPEQFEKKAWASEAVKFSQIKILYEEYMRFGGIKEAFDKEYPNLWTRYTLLLKAVRVARERRGDTKSRRRGRK
ncbi:hypothetical protein EYR40_009900 [Pleurotus pulmonarius]|nr:hypothetical protein EYR40_009900 [Pleurotus pulmonarius]